jgi:DNA-binding NtrC family response regulator
VDDTKDFVKYSSRRLRARGFEVYYAYNGDDALALADSHAIDVAVLDILMPGMDGLEVLKEIKRRYPEMQVLMLTGHGTKESAREGKKLGAFDYLLKPTAFNALVAAIERAYEARFPPEQHGPGADTSADTSDAPSHDPADQTGQGGRQS